MALVVWGWPGVVGAMLAAGLLTGKYDRSMLSEADRMPALPADADNGEGAREGGRLSGDNPAMTER